MIEPLWNMDEAAEELRITVPVLKLLIRQGNAPEHVLKNRKPYFTWLALEDYRKTKTILRSGGVISKVKARILGHRQSGSKERPVLACYRSQNSQGEPILLFIDPCGERKGFIMEEGVDPGSVYRSEGYFILEMPAPEMAGLSEHFLGNNALVLDYKHVPFYR